MERLTERFDNGQAAVMGCGENCKYDYKYCRNHYEDCPEINRLYERLAEYEDTGLTSAEICGMKERDTGVKPIYSDRCNMCRNCCERLMPTDRFCPNCGQRIKWEE